MARIQNMGKAQDMQQRRTLKRTDNDDRKRKVNIARNIIYQKNYAVNSKAVENQLKKESLVPTLVSTDPSHY